MVTFYQDLPAIDSFAEAVDSKSHRNLPDDWWVVVTDVVGSTKAIERGLYKHVNSLGVATIVAIVNVDRTTDVPYIFGGDGCICAVPPSMEHGVREAILGCQKMAIEAFGLELRGGLVRASELTAKGHWLRVGKLRTSRFMLQAALSGRGWEVAESLVKNPATRARYEVTSGPGLTANADLSGYECRWQGVKPRKDGALCALVQGLDEEGDKRAATYRDVLMEIDKIFGDQKTERPVTAGSLQLSFRPRTVWTETKVRMDGRSLMQRLGRFTGTYAQLLFGAVAMGLRLKFPLADWSTYKDVLIQNTDYRKFDGALKVVLDCTSAEAAAFERYLETQRQQGRLVFGLHRSSAALITCMIHSYQNAHFHFVDGADGGYAMAAKHLKRQLAEMGLGGNARLAQDASVQPRPARAAA